MKVMTLRNEVLKRKDDLSWNIAATIFSAKTLFDLVKQFAIINVFQHPACLPVNAVSSLCKQISEQRLLGG